MCLSQVYLIDQSGKRLVGKNIASMTRKNGKLVFTDLMGIPLTVDGEIEKVDLMENYIYVRETLPVSHA